LISTVAAYGGGFYEPSPLFERLVHMVDFDAAVAAQKKGGDENAIRGEVSIANGRRESEVH
jgi:hypothetical protein